MPQTTPERRARWPNGDEQAITHLEDEGYSLTHDWCWIKPTLDYEPTESDIDAVVYLIQEWDFGGMQKAKANEPRLRTMKAE